MEPLREPPGELASFPISYYYAGQLKRVGRSLNDASKVGAGASESRFPNYINCLCGVMLLPAVWILKTSDRKVQDFLQSGFALLNFLPLRSHWERGERRVRYRVGTDLDKFPSRQNSHLLKRK